MCLLWFLSAAVVQLLSAQRLSILVKAEGHAFPCDLCWQWRVIVKSFESLLYDSKQSNCADGSSFFHDLHSPCFMVNDKLHSLCAHLGDICQLREPSCVPPPVPSVQIRGHQHGAHRHPGGAMNTSCLQAFRKIARIILIAFIYIEKSYVKTKIKWKKNLWLCVKSREVLMDSNYWKFLVFSLLSLLIMIVRKNHDQRLHRDDHHK